MNKWILSSTAILIFFIILFIFIGYSSWCPVMCMSVSVAYWILQPIPTIIQAYKDMSSTFLFFLFFSWQILVDWYNIYCRGRGSLHIESIKGMFYTMCYMWKMYFQTLSWFFRLSTYIYTPHTPHGTCVPTIYCVAFLQQY